MKQIRVVMFSTTLMLLLCNLASQAQQTLATATNAIVPPLVNFSGTLTDVNAKPLTGLVGVTFYLYQDQQGGSPLWLETQNVQPDKTGHYTVLLGSTTSTGLPANLFASNEAHWLGVQVQGQEEQPRVLLVSAPYALKAGDAETVGGLPPSAFVLAGAINGSGGILTAAGTGSPVSPSAPFLGMANYIPVWTGPKNAGDSIMYQANGNSIGVGTTTPGATLDVNGNAITRGNHTVNGNLAATGVVSGGSYQIGSNLFAWGSATNQNAYLGFAGNPNSNNTGQYNTGTGYYALTKNTTGISNTAYGSWALWFNTTGTDNTATGGEALQNNTAGGLNTANGFTALYSNTEGSANTAEGISALSSNTTGSYNTASGVNALEFNTTGQFNTGIGDYAGVPLDGSNLTGNNNTALGVGADFSTGTLTNATAIGAFAEVAESNAMVLGSINGVNGATSNTSVGIGTTTPHAKLDVAGNSVETLIGDPACGSGFAGLGFVVSGGFNSCQNYALIGDSPGNLYVNSSLSGTIYFRNKNADLMTIDTSGDVHIKGNLSKGGGSFQIDHPLDPANKYLYHSFVESPDMKNIYDGNVVTNRYGVATVTLPNYFEALNRDFRYQLTVIGQFAQAIVAKEISGNRFAIRTSKPGVKVSWQVTGIRHDAYADAHRIEVEVEKPPQEQGHYLHPELFGAPLELAVGSNMPGSSRQAEGASVSSLQALP
jgi:hypothetical protein